MAFSHLLSSVLPWQVGGGGIKAHTHTRAPMTMGEVLEVMLAKARVEAEDAQVRPAVVFVRVSSFAREDLWEVVLVQVDKWRRRSTAQECSVCIKLKSWCSCWSNAYRARSGAGCARLRVNAEGSARPHTVRPLTTDACSACCWPASTAWRGCCCCKSCQPMLCALTERRWQPVSGAGLSLQQSNSGQAIRPCGFLARCIYLTTTLPLLLDVSSFSAALARV